MTHAFLLIVYLGQQMISQDMYFRNINDCKYFAERLNKQPPVPNRVADTDAPKSRSYVAVCEPRKVNQQNTLLY